MRGEAGAGPAFNIAAAGGTGVWSFKIIRTDYQTGLYAYVGVASESFSAAHGGAAYMFHLFDGYVCSTKNAHEQSFDTLVLQTSDVLKGKTDGALVEMRVREAGTYRLTIKLVNGRPAYQHTSDATRWIAFAGVGWNGQQESSLGRKSGYLYLRDSDAASPDVSAKPWTAWTGSTWVAVPQLKCTAWTPPPPPGLTLEVEAGPPPFEVLSAQSQTEEGGCVLRGKAGAGPAFNIAAAGGTGVWSFKIIRTDAQTGVYAYVGVASESFSAAHGGAAYMFNLFSGIIWSTKNAHEQSGDKLVLQTSDVLKGKTDGALIEMRVREAGGKRYVAFRVNGGGWNEVVADGLPGVVRPYARCH
jgi:hypothetical protein